MLRSVSVSGTSRRPASDFGACRPSLSSQPCSTWRQVWFTSTALAVSGPLFTVYTNINLAFPVLHAVIVDLLGRQLLRAELPMDDDQPELVGVRVANELRAMGASRILDSVRGAERVAAPQPD